MKKLIFALIALMSSSACSIQVDVLPLFTDVELEEAPGRKIALKNRILAEKDRLLRVRDFFAQPAT